MCRLADVPEFESTCLYVIPRLIDKFRCKEFCLRLVDDEPVGTVTLAKIFVRCLQAGSSDRQSPSFGHPSTTLLLPKRLSAFNATASSYSQLSSSPSLFSLHPPTPTVAMSDKLTRVAIVSDDKVRWSSRVSCAPPAHAIHTPHPALNLADAPVQAQEMVRDPRGGRWTRAARPPHAMLEQ
jgi:hypothetical protein